MHAYGSLVVSCGSWCVHCISQCVGAIHHKQTTHKVDYNGQTWPSIVALDSPQWELPNEATHMLFWRAWQPDFFFSSPPFSLSHFLEIHAALPKIKGVILIFLDLILILFTVIFWFWIHFWIDIYFLVSSLNI